MDSRPALTLIESSCSEAAHPDRIRPSIGSTEELQSRLIVSESAKTLVIGLASGWLLAAAMLHGGGDAGFAWRVLAWAGLLTLVLTRGILLSLSLNRHASSAEVHRRLAQLRINGIASAVTWGLSSSFMLPAGDTEHEAILILGIALITMGGAMGRAVHVPFIAALVLLTSVLFAIGLLTTPGALHQFIGVGYLFFGTVIALFTRAQVNAVKRERELNLEIQQLLRSAQAERERAEAARSAAEKAQQLEERAGSAKTRFLASASHDLRQPMHSISLLIGVLRARLNDPAQIDIADKVQSSVSTMENLFGNLLDISKLDAGAVHAHVEDVDLGWLLERAVQTWLPQAQEKGLTLRLRASGRWVVRGDATLLERIVGNLLANAIRYTRSGGVLVGCRRRGEACELQIWDTGPGIAPRHREAIFEEFFRIGAPGTGQEKGLGLGLSIVRRCVALLGYSISVESREGRGSVFKVSLPLVAGASAPLAAAGEVQAPLQALEGSFIVVIDDEATNREAVRDALLAAGCHVVTAASGEDALAQLEAHLRTPDLILTDYQLGAAPDGLGVIRLLRSHYDEAIPALVVTANTDARLSAEATTLGAGLLHKPVGLQRLLVALKESLDAA